MLARQLLVAAARESGPPDGTVDGLAVALARLGFDVELALPSSVGSLEPYEAVVLGSPVTAGRWRQDALELAQRIATEAPALPVWLFSVDRSDGVDGAAVPAADEAVLLGLGGVREHRVFVGSVPGRAATDGADEPGGVTVGSWARRIAADLGGATAPSVPFEPLGG